MRRCVALFRLIGPLQKPYRATPHALGIYKAKPFQMYEVVAEGTLGRLGGHFRSELTKGSSFPPSERLEQLALPWSKVVCNAMRCNIGAWKEAHAHGSSLLEELRFWMTSSDTQLNQSLSPSSRVWSGNVISMFLGSNVRQEQDLVQACNGNQPTECGDIAVESSTGSDVLHSADNNFTRHDSSSSASRPNARGAAPFRQHQLAPLPTGSTGCPVLGGSVRDDNAARILEALCAALLRQTR